MNCVGPKGFLFWVFLVFGFPLSLIASKSSSWDEVIWEAYDHSETLQILEKRWKRSLSEKDEFGGSLFPQLRLSGALGQGEYDLSGEDVSTSSGKLNLKQPIFQGLGEYAKLRSLKKGVAIAELKVAEGRVHLALELSQHFIKVLSSQINLSNLEKRRDNLKKRMVEIQRRTQIGKSRQADLIFSQAQLEEVRADLIEAEMVRSTLQSEFEKIYFNDQRVQIWDPLGKLNELPNESQLRKELTKHPSLALAELEIEQSGDEVEVVRSGHWPTLDLEGNYFLHRRSPTDGYKWDVALTLNFPLYQGGQVTERVRQRILNQGMKESELRRLRLDLEASMHTSFARWSGLQKKMDALRKAVELSEKNLALQTREFSMGLTSYLDVVQAEKSFWEVKRSWDLARLDARSAQLYLLILSGAYTSR